MHFNISSVKCSTPGRQFFFFLHTPVGGALVTYGALTLGAVLRGGPRSFSILQINNLEKIKITALAGRGSRFRSTFKHILSAQ